MRNYLYLWVFLIFIVMKRFVERFETKKIAVVKNLERLIECYGVRRFENGNVAIAEENEIKIFSSSGIEIDKGLFDVFYFKTGESVKKYNKDKLWSFLDRQGEIIMQTKKVMVLNDKMLALLTSQGTWKVFLLFDDLVPFLLFSSAKDNVLDIEVHSCGRTRINVFFIMPEEIEMQTVNLLSYKSSMSMMARSYKRVFNELYAVCCDDYLDVVASGENFVKIKSKNGLPFNVLGEDMRLKYRDVESIISLKNGHYFLNINDDCKLFSKTGQEIGHFRKVKVLDNGKIYASFEKGPKLTLVGRFVDSNVLFCVDDKVVISDGYKTRLVEKRDFMDFVFVN